MNRVHQEVAREHICSALVLFAFVAVTAPGADAKHRAATPAEQPETVVAHVPLAGSPTNQMDRQENDGKQYLYIGANSNQGVTIVDVTNPGQPYVIRRLAWPNQASIGKLQLVSGGLALGERADSGLPGGPPCAWPGKVEAA